MGGVTGRQGVLTPPRHLIPPLVFPAVRISLIFTKDCSIYICTGYGHLFWLQIFPFIWVDALTLTADCSVYLILITDFFSFEMGLTAGATGQQRMLTPPRHLDDLTSGMSRGPCLLCSRICISCRFYEIDYSSLFMLFINYKNLQ
jgi:hypothetical protein